MKASDTMRWLGYAASLATLVFGFLLFYSETKEAIGSFVAASLSAALVLMSFIMLGWLVQVFKK